MRGSGFFPFGGEFRAPKRLPRSRRKRRRKKKKRKEKTSRFWGARPPFFLAFPSPPLLLDRRQIDSVDHRNWNQTTIHAPESSSGRCEATKLAAIDDVCGGGEFRGAPCEPRLSIAAAAVFCRWPRPPAGALILSCAIVSQ